MFEMTDRQIKNFYNKIEIKPNECWEWTGYKNKLGYGYVSLNRKICTAHKTSYLLVYKKVPDGLVLDHLCRNPSCVNPNHLEPVTQRVNVLRGTAPTARNAAKTHCPQGHSYDNENTYIIPSINGRLCKTCQREHHKRYSLAKKTLLLTTTS